MARFLNWLRSFFRSFKKGSTVALEKRNEPTIELEPPTERNPYSKESEGVLRKILTPFLRPPQNYSIRAWKGNRCQHHPK